MFFIKIEKCLKQTDGKIFNIEKEVQKAFLPHNI